jgi:hypothetical protein
MSNLVLSIFLSSSMPSEEKQKNSSLFVLHSSLNLSQVLHQDFDLTAITELDDTLFANLANTLTGKVELATDFLQTLLVAAYTIAVAQNLALTVFQYRVENAVKLAQITKMEESKIDQTIKADNHHMSIDAPFGSDDDDNAMVDVMASGDDSRTDRGVDFESMASDTALLGNSLQDALTNPPYGV